MQRGLVYGVMAYGLWGLFPFFFKQLQHVASLQVVLHRMVWSLAFVLLILAVLRRWTWLQAVRHNPHLIGLFCVSSALLACNWLTYIWAVNHGHVLDASLGYFMLPLVNVALGIFSCSSAHDRRSGSPLALRQRACCGSPCSPATCPGSPWP